MRSPEQADEVGGIRIADTLRNNVHSLIRMKKTTAGFRHSAGDDPGDRASTRRSGQDGRDVRRAAAHGRSHFIERERGEAVTLDEVEALGNEASFGRAIVGPGCRARNFPQDQRQQALSHGSVGAGQR